MDFTAFDTKKIEEYRERAKAQWGDTPAYQEYEKKNGHRSAKEENVVMHGLLELFVEFGGMKEMAADENKPQAQVKKLQDYISEHFYHCTNEILAGLGQMYAADGEFKRTSIMPEEMERQILRQKRSGSTARGHKKCMLALDPSADVSAVLTSFFFV